MTQYSHWEIQQHTHNLCKQGKFDELVAGQLGFSLQPGYWHETTQRDVLKAYGAWLHESSVLLESDDSKDAKYLQRLLGSTMADEQAMAFHEEVELVTERTKERRYLRQALSRLSATEGIFPPRPPCIIETIELERPVITGRDFKIGNLDCLVSYREPQLVSPEILLPLFPKEVELSAVALFEVVWSNVCYAEFECKSAIHDPGELFRQLYDHRRGMPNPLKQFVVSPDTRYAQLIRDQGFGFIQFVPVEEDVPFDDPQMHFDLNDL